MKFYPQFFRGKVVGFLLVPHNFDNGILLCLDATQHGKITVKCPATGHLSIEGAEQLAAALTLGIKAAHFYRTNQEPTAVEDLHRYLEENTQ